MKEESSWGKKFLTLSTSLVLAAGTTVAATSPAHADGLGSIRIVSSTPTIDTTTNGYNNQAAMDGWIAPPNGYYPAGSTLKQTYVDTGSSFSITYEVRDSSNALMPTQAIKVSVNKAYSGSRALLNCNGTEVAASSDTWPTAADGATLTLTTNAQGRATLNCDNSDVAASGMARPSSLVSSSVISGGLHTQIWAYIAGQEAAYAGDMQEYWFLTPASVVIPPRTAPSTVMTFETNDTLAASILTEGHTWSGTLVEMANNPAGGNAGKSLKITKGAGDPWSGVNMVLWDSGTTKITDASHPNITMNVFSSATTATPMQLNLVTRGNSAARLAVTVQPGWNRLTYNMSTANGYTSSNEYVTLALFPDFQNNDLGSASSSSTAETPAGQFYYIDDLAFNGGTTPALPSAVTRATITRAAALAGTAKKTKVLTGTAAAFGGSTSTKANQWYRCTATASAATTSVPSNCTAIAGKTGTTYTLTSTDVGKYIRFGSKATNSAGVTTSLSKSSAKVTN